MALRRLGVNRLPMRTSLKRFRVNARCLLTLNVVIIVTATYIPASPIWGGMSRSHTAMAQALVVLSSPLFYAYRVQIAALTVKHRLPAIFLFGFYPEAGGLMSYGMNIADMYRHGATYVDKILKGASPADLPVEQPTKFELIINQKTAKQLGLTIPPLVLFLADQVIQ